MVLRLNTPGLAARGNSAVDGRIQKVDPAIEAKLGTPASGQLAGNFGPGMFELEFFSRTIAASSSALQGTLTLSKIESSASRQSSSRKSAAAPTTWPRRGKIDLRHSGWRDPELARDQHRFRVPFLAFFTRSLLGGCKGWDVESSIRFRRSRTSPEFLPGLLRGTPRVPRAAGISPTGYGSGFGP